MPSDAQTAPVSKKGLWAGRIMTGLVVTFLTFDAILKFVTPAPAPVVEAFAHVGWPLNLAPVLGMILLVSTVLYVIPKTSILGAILLTGYLGGAVATHLRAGDPLFSHVLFPTYLGVLLWGGLYFREDRLRALIPLRSPKAA
ncbi:MAG TPA: DoxX family protein [Candidatus Elarobacter sp.]|nr:DoxX family protein [Candidatus Elarobacter sp.]